MNHSISAHKGPAVVPPCKSLVRRAFPTRDVPGARATVRQLGRVKCAITGAVCEAPGLETFSLAEVSAAVRQALLCPAIAFDAVKHLLLCAIEGRPPKLDLENYPHLPLAEGGADAGGGLPDIADGGSIGVCHRIQGRECESVPAE